MLDVPADSQPIRVLTRGDVRRCLEGIDVVAVVEDALRTHSQGHASLPTEAYLTWDNSHSAYCRSLAMPGSLELEGNRVLGLKVINAAVSNPEWGLPRAAGFTTLFDAETGRPRVIAEGALISALRTAAYTIVSVKHVGPRSLERVTMLGCGNLAGVHASMLRTYFPTVRHLDLFDARPRAAAALAHAWKSDGSRSAAVHATPQKALAGANVVLTLTTSNAPYIEANWLDENAFVAHVSLDDLQGEVFTTASAIIVDDIDLVEENPRRILGGLLKHGVIARSPHGTNAPSITGSLGEILCGRVVPPEQFSGRVISNPFGMAILDLALLDQIEATAADRGMGGHLDLLTETPGRAFRTTARK